MKSSNVDQAPTASAQAPVVRIPVDSPVSPVRADSFELQLNHAAIGGRSAFSQKHGFTPRTIDVAGLVANNVEPMERPASSASRVGSAAQPRVVQLDQNGVQGVVGVGNHHYLVVTGNSIVLTGGPGSSRGEKS